MVWPWKARTRCAAEVAQGLAQKLRSHANPSLPPTSLNVSNATVELRSLNIRAAFVAFVAFVACMASSWRRSALDSIS